MRQLTRDGDNDRDRGSDRHREKIRRNKLLIKNFKKKDKI